MLGMEQMYKMALDPRIFPDSRLLAVMQGKDQSCLLYTSPSPRDRQKSRMPSSA